MKSKLLILIFALVSFIIVFNEDKQDHNQFTSDACGYYLYLPATFIYHDVGTMGFYHAADSEYHHTFLVEHSLYNLNGKIVDKYPIGVAIFELPLFLLAHTYCTITHNYKPDGFTLPYQFAAICSNILWVILGLFVLRRFLKQYFSDNITAITLLAIAFGTNLYAYTAFIVGMSHPFSFFLFSCLLYLTDISYKDTKHAFQSIVNSILLGCVLGMIFIMRPVNIAAAIIPVLWKVDSISSLKDRILQAKENYKNILLVLLSLLLVALPQFAYWKYSSGHWLFYSYMDEGFNFLHPRLWNGLFSYRKGWFLYTPMALVAIAGFYYLWKKDKALTATLIAFFIINIYIVFSWRQWWYGGSFGCRPLLESLSLLAVPLAALIEHAGKNSIKKAGFFTLLLFIITLNILQTYQYSMGLLHWSRMTKEYYWHIFGHLSPERAQYDQYLIPANEENKDEYK